VRYFSTPPKNRASPGAKPRISWLSELGTKSTTSQMCTLLLVRDDVLVPVP
jgi:hypothetical protein